MVFFHLCFDLNNFHFIHIDIYHAKEWAYLRKVILVLFLGSVGISLVLANKSSINIAKVKKRFVLLAVSSLLISIASYITFPKTYIYFGVLHFIMISSLLGLLFIKHEYIALIFGLTILILFNLKFINMHPLYNTLQPLLSLPLKTEDLVPLIPWFGVVLIGIFIGRKKLFLFPLTHNKFSLGISFLGKHALIIYLTHQVFLFGTIAGFDYILH